MKNGLFEQIESLVALARDSGLLEMSLKEKGVKVAFRRSPSEKEDDCAMEPVASSEEPVADEEILVHSPMVGTFRRAVDKGRPPLVLIGNHIKAGDRLGVVECMKIPTDVVSYAGGEIVKIMVEDGQPVEYGQPLFTVRPQESGAVSQ